MIIPLNEWYRLMRGYRAQRTRDTYLAALRPWFGFLAQRGSIEGWFIRATNKTPISPNGLHVLLSALRNFYDVMIRGVWVPEDRRSHPLYPYENPMYSRLLLAWRREHRRWIRNAGAPDHAGIRSESRADTARQPVGYFQVKRQPLEPPGARDAEPVRLVILAGVRYMIDHASARDAVILRILLGVHVGVGQQTDGFELIRTEQVDFIDHQDDASASFVFFRSEQALGLGD